ncbi:MAG: AI-2E family transporter [Clostridia bacterium]|nr:AI-2E family transporter [Clostridia bacterium]
MKKKIENFTFWIVAFVFCVAVIVVYKTFDNFNSVLEAVGKIIKAFSPFITGFIIAYILNLPIKKLSGLIVRCKIKFIKNHSMGISILLSYIGALAIVSLVVGAVVPALYKNIYDFYINSGTYVNNLKEFIKNIEIFKNLGILQNIDSMNIPGVLVSILGKIDGSSVEKYAAGVVVATSNIVNILVAVIASVYMILEKDTITACCKRAIRAFVKFDMVDDVFSYCHRINEIFTSYIYSRLLVCLAMGAMCSVVLTLMGVKYAFALGMFIGMCDIIPYFGSIFATIFAIFITFLSGSIWDTVWIAVVLVILQQIDGNILAPRIMGHKLEISPLLTVVSVVVGGNLFGFAGMLFCVPVAAILKVICSEALEYVEERRRLKDSKKTE